MAASYYPIDEDTESPRVAMTVRMPAEARERLDFMADLWNALDLARGKTDSVKWKPTSVIERLVTVGLKGFEAQIGGWPETDETRAAMIASAEKVIERLKQAEKLKK